MSERFDNSDGVFGGFVDGVDISSPRNDAPGEFKIEVKSIQEIELMPSNL